MSRKKQEQNFIDLDDDTRCTFKHINKNSFEIIQTRLKRFIKAKNFDNGGLASCVPKRNGVNEMVFTRREVNTIRDNIDSLFTEEAASVWFSIDVDPFHGLFERSLNDDGASSAAQSTSTFRAVCHFGSLYSYSCFYSHETNNNKVVDVKFQTAHDKIDRIRIRLNGKQYVIVDLDSIQMENILINHRKSGSVYVLLPLNYTPTVVEVDSDDDDDSNKKKERKICGDNRSDLISNISMCSDIVLNFASKDASALTFLRSIIPVDRKGHLINFSTFQVADWSSVRKGSTPDPFDYKRSSFKDRYGLMVLTSLGDVFRDKWALATDATLKWNECEPSERYDICCFVADRLQRDHGYDLLNAKEDYNLHKAIKSKNKEPTDPNEVNVRPEDRIDVACCSLTPLRVIFKPLETTIGCRALRLPDFGGSKNFLLVHFREEDQSSLRRCRPPVQQYLKNKMTDGIQLFNKRYRYFGASTSQMKEQSFWFIDLPSEFRVVTDAYQRLGDFGKIKNIATYIARIGQYFSSTWPVGIRLSRYDKNNHRGDNPHDPYYLEIPDVESNGKTFTDGIGKISWGLAGLIAIRMRRSLYSKEDIPSAFQIRVAGCKGMVAIDPESTMDQYYIHVRPSMIKFQSDNWYLEICEFSRDMPLVMNKQVIRLLEDLGNTYSSFETYQIGALANWTLTARRMPSIIDIGLHKRISYVSQKEALLDVKIPIPESEGRTLFGVVDETDTLEYGQCFIQYSRTRAETLEKQYHVLTGNVIVTKNPCLWPGDVRCLTAVKNAKLQACMRDVIVFPRKGKRPHPNEIAGSDLDGDQYWVYWGDLFKVPKMIEPLSYESGKKAETLSIDYEAIIDHIIEQFSGSGVVGQICNLHTRVAETQKEHTLCSDCKLLAEMFSIAVDAPKTGKTIKPDELNPIRRRNQGPVPIFMWKTEGPYFDSKSVTSKLFTEGRKKYFQTRENPHGPELTRQPTRRRDLPPREIRDESLRKWLEKLSDKKPREGKKPSDKTRPESAVAPVEKKTGRQSSTKPKGATKDAEDDSDNDRREPPAVPKTNPKKSERPVLINTDAPSTRPSTSASSSSSFFSFSGEKCSADFLFGVEGRIIATSAVKFTGDSRSNFTIHLAKTSGETDTINAIVEKLVSRFDKYDIFKKKSADYKPEEHGPLHLIGLYGQIQFIGSTESLAKFGDVVKLFESNHEQRVQFLIADLSKLEFQQGSKSSTKKDAIEYEVECCLNSSQSQIISLFFDSSKKLSRIGLSIIWMKCYVRQPSFIVDSAFEIRSMVVYDSTSQPYLDMVGRIFKNWQKTDLLTGRKPNVGLQTNILNSEVRVIRLKHIEEDQNLSGSASSMKSYYRHCEYLPIAESATASNRLATLEYHAQGIKKDSDTFKVMFEEALAPAAKPATGR